MIIRIGLFWQVAALAFACLILGACDVDGPPTYRYRLTVEVNTPDGLKTGSSVIQVRQRMVRSSSAPAVVGVSRSVWGEAVAIDLPNERTLFALLRSDHSVDWAANVMQTLAPSKEGETFEQQLDNMLALKGEIVLPRMFPPVGHLPERTAYPMFVTFSDLSAPTSVKQVDPDDLENTFGEGYSLERITVEITDGPVTTGIVERLEWLPQTTGTLLYHPRDTPIGDLPLEYQVGQISFLRVDGK